jgi:hypothetical protein
MLNGIVLRHTSTYDNSHFLKPVVDKVPAFAEVFITDTHTHTLPIHIHTHYRYTYICVELFATAACPAKIPLLNSMFAWLALATG